MKQEVKPAVFWVLIGALVVVVAVIGFRMFSSAPPKQDTTGSDQSIQKFQQTGTFYQPPAGAPIPMGARGGSSGGGPGSGAPPMSGGPGGYNFTPPSR